jgi:hypothetical protein
MKPQCSVPGCSINADVEVILYDVYPHGEVFFEQDSTCPYLCMTHVLENENTAVTQLLRREAEAIAGAILSKVESTTQVPERTGPPKARRVVDLLKEPSYDGPPLRQPRGEVKYRYTNQNHAQGFTIYRPLRS